jgi:hypothetical protein
MRNGLKTRQARCDCEKAGAVRSGVPGIVAGVQDSRGRRLVERCDACERFESDEAAGMEYARIQGGGSSYDHNKKVLWTPE